MGFYRKPNVIEVGGLSDWVATQKMQYATDQRDGKRLVLGLVFDTFLCGDFVVTHGDDVLYRGRDMAAAVDAFNDA